MLSGDSKILVGREQSVANGPVGRVTDRADPELVHFYLHNVRIALCSRSTQQ